MMECQFCGDREGPWVYTKDDGILCEDCYNYKKVCNDLVELIKSHKRTRGKTTMDIVTFMDGIEETVYDELGIK